MYSKSAAQRQTLQAMALVFSCWRRLNEVALCFAPLTVIYADRMSFVSTWLKLHRNNTKSRIRLKKVYGLIYKLNRKVEHARMQPDTHPHAYAHAQSSQCYLCWPLLAYCAVPCRAEPRVVMRGLVGLTEAHVLSANSD